MRKFLYLGVYSTEAAVGSEELEMEIAYYGRLVDRSVLTKAFHVEAQEQYAIFPPKKPGDNSTGQVRVRKTTVIKNGRPQKPTFELTAKTPYAANGARIESNVEITEEFFETFKRTAETSMVKTRYKFYPKDIAEVYPRARIIVEMDVFEKTDWVKIDVEGKGFLPPDQDYFEKGTLAEVIPYTQSKRTPEQERWVRKLYDVYFK